MMDVVAVGHLAANRFYLHHGQPECGNVFKTLRQGCQRHSHCCQKACDALSNETPDAHFV